MDFEFFYWWFGSSSVGSFLILQIFNVFFKSFQVFYLNFMKFAISAFNIVRISLNLIFKSSIVAIQFSLGGFRIIINLGFKLYLLWLKLFNWDFIFLSKFIESIFVFHIRSFVILNFCGLFFWEFCEGIMLFLKFFKLNIGFMLVYLNMSSEVCLNLFLVLDKFLLLLF